MDKIWFNEISLDKINKTSENTLTSHLRIEITTFSENTLTGIMPVDNTTKQPYGLLHGGASCVLSETLGSIAANLTIDPSLYAVVGHHIEATHIKSVTSGFVEGTATPVHLGKSSQLWRIEIFDQNKKLVCDSKILMAVIKK